MRRAVFTVNIHAASPLSLDNRLARLPGYLCGCWTADDVVLNAADRLGGGAIQENIALDVAVSGGSMAGEHALVLRTDAPSSVSVSLDRLQEFRVLQAAHSIGVTVPEPVLACDDEAVLGQPFVLMRRIPGMAVGRKLVRDSALAGQAGDDLATTLGQQLACLHQLHPAHELAADLGFLGSPPANPMTARIALYRRYLDELPPADSAGRLALEYGLRWLERRMDDSEPVGNVLIHADFRTGNYMVADGQLTGILDWEFAAWSDPMEDLGWFLARCWRFGQMAREAGGIGSREALYQGYDQQAEALGLPHRVDHNRVLLWEVMALIRWGIIALQQGDRVISGGEQSLELALTGPIALECATHMLTQITELEGGRA